VAVTGWRLLTGTLTKYGLLAVNIGIGVFLMPFTIRHLGTSDYGLWMLVASLTSYFQLLDLGYGSGLVRQIADADARADAALVNRLLSTFVVVYGALGLAASAGVAALALWVVPGFPHLPAGQITRAQILLAIIGVRIAIGFPMTVFGAVTTARQRFALNNVVAIAVALVNGGVTYVVLASGRGLVTLVTATTAVSLASYAVYAWTAKAAFPALRLAPSSFSRRLVREVTTFSVYLFVIDIAIQIGFNMDNVVVAAALGTSAVAIYAVALKLADYQRQLCNQFNSLLFPVVVRYSAGGQHDALRATLVDGTRIALTLVTGVTICVIGFASPLIARWIGPSFEAGVVPLYVLAIAGVVLVGQGPLGNVLLATGHHRLVAWVSLGEALANLALSVALVRPLGILGVAIGTAVPIVAANLFVLLPAACRQTGIGVGAFVRGVATAPLAGIMPATAAVVFLRRALPPASLLMVVAEGAIVGVVYAASAWGFGLSGELRARYVSDLQQILASAPLGRLRAIRTAV
jgi:O-antigen/teichoic acid export membrane protein